MTGPADPHPRLPDGFAASGVACGVRATGRLDLGLIVASEAQPAAAVFTRNLHVGAHVTVARESHPGGAARLRAIVVNSGNANCSTGAEGIADNRRVAAALAEELGCAPAEVLFLSTGVIGERLPVERILNALPGLTRVASANGLEDFARAVMTTDTVPKVVAHGRVTGVAKGSGMIHPDMATMLGWLVTGAALPADPLPLLRRVCDSSFNRVTVDGDTSPNDTVILWGADGTCGDEAALESELRVVAVDLARRIARDGEGATRLVSVEVRGAPDEKAAVRVGRVIATSPLVKTAVNGRDPNWGRILSAAGRAGVPFDPERARVWIGAADLYAAGRPLPDHEAAAHRHMLAEDEVRLGVDLAQGPAAATVWTCDFSADYVRINADYRS